jgi:hypothetical protein
MATMASSIAQLLLSPSARIFLQYTGLGAKRRKSGPGARSVLTYPVDDSTGRLPISAREKSLKMLS